MDWKTIVSKQFVTASTNACYDSSVKHKPIMSTTFRNTADLFGPDLIQLMWG